jgi:predicted dehydrogenase
MNIGIIGCGLIGNKRSKALAGANLVATADLDLGRAETLASDFPGAEAFDDWQKLVTNDAVDIVVVATTNNVLAEITLAAIEAGKHVLVEKPAARNADELKPLIAAAMRAGVQVRVGFNHRYHPAFIKVQELFDSGVLGKIMFIRGRYGHGGRIGYDREWRADPELSGGGELLDQGVHLIDLARLFMGNFPHVDGYAATYFWDMPVDDNGFMMLRTEQMKTAWLHVSCSEWKNMFSFEIYGKNAKIQIDGLGGSYGVERLTYHKMLPEMGPPETTIWEYPRGDNSWELEFEEFLEDICLSREPSANLDDALQALRIVEKIYEVSEK